MGIALFSILLCIYLFFGLYILSLNYKVKLNQLFFVVCCCFSLVCLGAIFNQAADLDVSIQRWYKFSLILYHFCWYLILVYYINLTKIIRPVWYTYLILAVPITLLIVLLLLRGPYSIFYYTKNGIRYVINYYSSFSKLIPLINIVTFFYLSISIILLVIAYRKTIQRKIKRQIIIILTAQALSVLLAFIDHIVLFYWYGVFTSRIPGFILLYSLLWISGIWISLVKYRFMSITPAMISQDILSNIDECVILLDNDMKIISINDKIPEMMHTKRNYLNSHISALIDHYDTVSGEIVKLKQGKCNDFSCRLNFTSETDSPLCMDVKFKCIRDKYADLIGILMIAKEVKELRQLKCIYRITDREAIVIQSVISGKTNHGIAVELSIAERTVKAHLTNIFNKLGVDNKMQLVMLLKNFNLIPEKQADKILFSR